MEKDSGLQISGGVLIMAHRVVKMFSQLNALPEKNSGYFTIRTGEQGLPLHVNVIGNCPKDKALKYYTLSLEKGQRLVDRPLDSSSYQSRDSKAWVVTEIEPRRLVSWGKWGGAIRIPGTDRILSFSGLPELGDEAVVLVIAARARWVSVADAYRIANISQNKYFQPLLQHSYLQF